MDTSGSEGEKTPVRPKKLTKTRGAAKARVLTAEQKEKARQTSKLCRRFNILTKPDFLVNERKRSERNRKTIDQLTFAEAELRRKKQRRAYRKRKGIPDYDSSDDEETRAARDKRRARCKRDIKYKEEPPKEIEVIVVSSDSEVEDCRTSTPAVMLEPEYIVIASDDDSCNNEKIQSVSAPKKPSNTSHDELCEQVTPSCKGKEDFASIVAKQNTPVTDTSSTHSDDELCEQATSSPDGKAEVLSIVDTLDKLVNDDTADKCDTLINPTGTSLEKVHAGSSSSSKVTEKCMGTVTQGQDETLMLMSNTVNLVRKLVSLMKPGVCSAQTG